MESKRFLCCLLIVIVVPILNTSQGYKFYVGGGAGWVVNPLENYNHWAERNRFQVNETLFFKYKKGLDSVLLVTREDYYCCNTKNPIQSFIEGDSIFIFDHSGPFFFISGNTNNCNKGQKLIVVVMAIRRKSQHQQANPPPVESPKINEDVVPSYLDVPIPAPLVYKSGSLGLVCATWLVLSFSIWVTMVLGSM